MAENLCTACAKLIIKQPWLIDEDEPNNNLPHHQNLAELKSSAELSGCSACRVLWAAIQQDSTSDIIEHCLSDRANNGDLKDSVLSLNIWWERNVIEIGVGEASGHHTFRKLNGAEFILGTVALIAAFGTLVKFPNLVGCLFCVDSEAARSNRGRFVMQSSDPAKRRGVVQLTKLFLDWSSMNVHDHAHAYADELAIMPDRVIDLGGPTTKILD